MVINSFVIKLNQDEAELLIKMIENNEKILNKNEIMGYDELVCFTDMLLQQNIQYQKVFKKIEFTL
ncbi:MAG: hypothetical protein COB15_12430 [Flavobacteriales bacterium]|nr:MAG: hypothetical protein COB15_12430 [Flavobacteriales bacterium]